MFWTVLHIVIIVIVWLFSFMLLVLAHEFGHFITAKKSWVKVLEFGLWIPPKLFKFFQDKDWTEYTINAIPLWWFVRLKWEDPEKKDEFNARDSLIKAKIWKKAIILLGWVAMNFLVARLIFTFLFKTGTTPISIIPEWTIKSQQNSYLMPTVSFLQSKWILSWEIISDVFVWNVWKDSIAEKIWLQSWDKIVQINNIDITYFNLTKNIKESSDKEIKIIYERDWILVETTWFCEKNCILWIVPIESWNINELIQEIKMPLWNAMLAWLQEIKAESMMTFSALWTLWSNLISFDKTKIKSSINSLTWPAWAIKIWEKLLQEWWRKMLLWFAGMISLALAIFNILPIPALDWWRLLWSIIQRIFKLKPEKYFTIEGYINIVFFVLLMWLGILILLKDLVRFRNVPIPFIG